MSDYRFGCDYKLDVFPKEAIKGYGELDVGKIEAVDIEWAEFIRKPDDRSRWFDLFGTPERAVQTLKLMCDLSSTCDFCLLSGRAENICGNGDYDALLEWLRGDE